MSKITRRNAIRLLGAVAAMRVSAQQAPQGEKAASSDPSPVAFEVKSKGLAVGLTKDGHIIRLQLGDKSVAVPFHACTALGGCQVERVLFAHSGYKGGVEFTSTYAHEKLAGRCSVMERIFPTANSIRWEIEILGDTSQPWTTAIETQLAWLNPHGATFWTAWDAPVSARAGGGPEIPEANPRDSREPWIDPLKAAKFVDRVFRYGGLGADGDAFSVPIASIMDSSRELGISLVQSPEDRLLDMSLSTTVFGDVILSRTNHRIASGKPMHFAMDLVSHPADWRGALGWMVERYPSYFESPNPEARSLDGSGAYSGYDGPLDQALLKKMAFNLNWNAHFDFPFLGMSIPPVPRGTEWKSWYQTPTSFEKMERYELSMKRAGFHVLEYFVVTECGNYIQDAPPPQRAASPAEFWRDGNDFVHRVIPNAVLRDNSGKIRYSNWFNNVVVDPADPAWQKSLLDQARTLVRELSSSSGVCIDRMDWLRLYNPHADDGCSWIDGKPARFLVNSWKETVAKLSDVLHPAGKVMYGNTLIRRLDTVNHLDGFYDEYGDHPRMLNLTAFLSVRKPAIGWTRNINTLRPDPDALFQRHLHLGIFPTVPFPHADHTIVSDPWVDGFYDDYGPLLQAMQGKRWVLEPHVLTCSDERASVNLFEVPDGFVIPVTFSQSAEVSVSARLPLAASSKVTTVDVLYPGKKTMIQAPFSVGTAGTFQISAPLYRNCALIHLRTN